MEPIKIKYSPSTQLIIHSLEGVKIFEPHPESDKPIPLLSLQKDGKDYLVENSISGTSSAFYSPSGKFINVKIKYKLFIHNYICIIRLLMTP